MTEEHSRPFISQLPGFLGRAIRLLDLMITDKHKIIHYCDTVISFLYNAMQCNAMVSKGGLQHYQKAALLPTCHDLLNRAPGAVAGVSHGNHGEVVRASAGQVGDGAGAAGAITALTHQGLPGALLSPGVVPLCTGTHLPAHIQRSSLAVQLRGHNLWGAGSCGDTSTQRVKVVLGGDKAVLQELLQ